MKNELPEKTTEYLKKHRQNSSRNRFLLFLSCITVFSVVYLLIIPATTMEKTPICGLEEHTHGESCYEYVTVTAADGVTEEEARTDGAADTANENPSDAGSNEQTDGTAGTGEEPYGDAETDGDENPSDEEKLTAENGADETETDTAYAAEGGTALPVSAGNAEKSKTEEPVTEKVLICTKTVHKHDEMLCYDEGETLSDFICGFGGHTHTNTCFGADGQLVCSVPEHTHTDKCRRDYSAPVTVFSARTDSGITVGAECGIDGQNILSAAEINGEELNTLRSVLNPSGKLDFAFSLSLKNGKKDVQPNGRVKITVKGLDLELDADELAFTGFLTDTDNVKNSQKIENIEYDGDTVSFETDRISPFYLTADYRDNGNIVGEQADPTAIIRLKKSGYFDYWQKIIDSEAEAEAKAEAVSAGNGTLRRTPRQPSTGGPSDVQIKSGGGTKTSDDGIVTVSKTIAGTDIENVFDISLKVTTKEEIKTYYKDPDASIVIVMDISNTMASSFGSTTRYEAAMKAAETFIDKFAQESAGVSKIGYVAFNTSAKTIFPLQKCSTPAQATALKNKMRTETGKIISAAGYAGSHERFTNIEGGLKLGRDMLTSSGNKYKYIIFLSDGFPTTYVSSGYTGYDPYCSSGTPGNNGVFYDFVKRKYCPYGTSYSDKAAILARQMASDIKNRGMKIFSIGIDVGGQTVQAYVDQTAGKNFSVVDRTSTVYEVGSATSAQAYKNWLKNSIGSGYYYDSTNQSGLINAYTKIFEEMKKYSEQEMASLWVTIDPMPATIDPYKIIDFVGFYNKSGVLSGQKLIGSAALNAENTADYLTDKTEINWDLKKSGFTKQTEGSVTTYYYELIYRVRLENETAGFAENVSYNTNDPTYLEYQTILNMDGNLTYSEVRTVSFPIPSVEGYLSELEFIKKDSRGEIVPSAVFTLRHDTAVCSVCRGDSTAVHLNDMTASSGADGKVRFTNIPSGHIYTLKETTVPEGYLTNGDTYSVTVAFDVITVTVTHPNGSVETWNTDGGGTIVNVNKSVVLPATGGNIILLYITGAALVFTSLCLLTVIGLKRKKGRRI